MHKYIQRNCNTTDAVSKILAVAKVRVRLHTFTAQTDNNDKYSRRPLVLTVDTIIVRKFTPTD